MAADDYYTEDAASGMTMLPSEHGDGGVNTPDGPCVYPRVKVRKMEMIDGQDHLIEESTVGGKSFADGVKSVPAAKIKGRKARADTACHEQAPERIQLTQVKLTGMFGSASVPCERVFVDGKMLVMVIPADGAFFSPPASEDPVLVSWQGYETQAYPVDVAFQDPVDGRRFMVLIRGE